MHREPQGDAVRVDRATEWGNPYRVGRDGDRDRVIALYREHVLRTPSLLMSLHELRGRGLACWCHPMPCHADVLLELANGLRLLVCGGRRLACRNGTMRRRLDTLHDLWPVGMLIQGGQGAWDDDGEPLGADHLAQIWARDRGIAGLTFMAEWDDLDAFPLKVRTGRDGRPYNAAAGSIRNGRMLRVGRPDVVAGFPGGPGTADMLDRARRARVEVIDWR